MPAVATPTAVLRFVQLLVGPPLRWFLRARVSGAEHVPRTGAVLLAPNHRSFLDHFLVIAACPRPVRFLGKAELARGASGWWYTRLGMVPVQRGTADAEALEAVGALLQRGEAVVIFPEGTRSVTGELFRFRGGLTRLAQATGTPIVPMGLRGTAEVWPLGASRPVRRPGRGVVEARFGMPLPPPGEGPAARRALQQHVWEQVAALCGQPRAERFAPIEREEQR